MSMKQSLYHIDRLLPNGWCTLYVGRESVGVDINGKTHSIGDRWRTHIRDARVKPILFPIDKLIAEYGEENFRCETYWYEGELTLSHAEQRENELIDSEGTHVSVGGCNQIYNTQRCGLCRVICDSRDGTFTPNPKSPFGRQFNHFDGLCAARGPVGVL